MHTSVIAIGGNLSDRQPDHHKAYFKGDRRDGQLWC